MLANTCPHCGKDRGNAGNNCPHCEAKVEKQDRSPRRTSISLMRIISLGLLLGIYLAYPVVQNFLNQRVSGQFTHCATDMKNIGIALDMYAQDHKGKYPTQLQDVVPKYIKEIPTCPAANHDSYSISYVRSKTRKAYTFTCVGMNHKRIIEADYPQYNSRQGLIYGK